VRTPAAVWLTGIGPERWLIGVVLLVAAAIRLWGLLAGIPYAVGAGETEIVDRALHIVRTADWNPRFFDYPGLLVYLQVGLTVGRYLWGALDSEWRDLAMADPAAFYAWGRVLVAVFGTLTVWITYRLGWALESRWLGVVAAAQLAVMPLHVQESQVLLPEVPATCLAMASILLALRALQLGTAGASAWAGAAAGLAGAASYGAAMVLVVPALGWALQQGDRDRWRKAGAMAGAFAAAFLVAAPYTVLDLPSFLNGVGAVMGRASSAARAATEPAALPYLRQLTGTGIAWLPASVIGVLLVLMRRDRRSWLPLFGFLVVYGYLLATHPPAVASRTMPLVPVLCLVTAATVTRVAAFVRRQTGSREIRMTMIIGVGILLMLPLGWQSVRRGRQLERPDTRTLAAERMTSALPRGAKVAVEASGPSNLGHAGFTVVMTSRLIDHDRDWYVNEGVDYLVVSSADLAAAGYDKLWRTAPVLQIPASAERPGPPIRVFPVQP
jgi:4-amino-4-deoxy-L-arabinose transferase-like glycosyltransferase